MLEDDSPKEREELLPEDIVYVLCSEAVYVLALLVASYEVQLLLTVSTYCGRHAAAANSSVSRRQNEMGKILK